MNLYVAFQIREGFDSELTSLKRWLYERKQFNLIFGVETFAKFRQVLIRDICSFIMWLAL